MIQLNSYLISELNDIPVTTNDRLAYALLDAETNEVLYIFEENEINLTANCINSTRTNINWSKTTGHQLKEQIISKTEIAIPMSIGGKRKLVNINQINTIIGFVNIVDVDNTLTEKFSKTFYNNDFQSLECAIKEMELFKKSHNYVGSKFIPIGWILYYTANLLNNYIIENIIDDKVKQFKQIAKQDLKDANTVRIVMDRIHSLSPKTQKAIKSKLINK